MIRRVGYLAFIILFISVLLSADAPIKFYKENTTISLTHNTISVKGLYFFENTTDFEIDVDMVYRFHVDIFNPFPKKINVFNPEDPLEFTKEKKGIKCTLHFTPVGIETVSVEYSQTIKQKKATYILKKFWNSKTDKTTLVIETPISFNNVNLSIEPDSVHTKKKTRLHFITKRFYQPKSNLRISWE